MEKSVTSFSKKTQRQFKKSSKSFMSFSSLLRKGLIIGGIVLGLNKIKTALFDLVTVGAEFENILIAAAIKLPERVKKGTKEFMNLEAVVKNLGATTEFTASQVAKGVDFLAFAGFSLKQTIAALPAALDIATAVQTDLATATDIATDALGAFGLATRDPIKLTKNLNRAMDVLTKTATSANTDVLTLFESFKQAAPVATALGQSIETFNTLAGVMANQGIKGSQAGTTLKNVFLKLVNPTGEAANLMSQLGIKTKDSKGNMIDAIKILEQFEKKLKSMGNAQKGVILDTIFGKRAIAGISAILKTGSKELFRYRKTLINSRGAAKEMANVMRQGLLPRFKIFKSVIEAIKLTVFKRLEPFILRLTISFTEFAQSINTWVKANGELITNFFTKFENFIIDKGPAIIKTLKALGTSLLLIGGALGLLVKVIVKINNHFGGKFIPFVLGAVVAIKALTLAFAAFNFILALNPIVLIVAAIVAAIALFIVAVKQLGLGFGFLLAIIAGFSFPVAIVVAGLALLIKNFDKVKAAFAKFKDVAKNIGRFFGIGEGSKDINLNKNETVRNIPVGSNQNVIRSIERKENASILDVNFNNKPEDVDVVPIGTIPGLNLNLGSTF
jgi:TP901 family phage tail tape measure protein